MTLSVTSSSSNVNLPSTASPTNTTNAGPVGGNTVLRIANTGTGLAFVRWGVGAQTAVTTDMPILPGTVEVFGMGLTANNVAAITATGSTTLYITCGDGQ